MQSIKIHLKIVFEIFTKYYYSVDSQLFQGVFLENVTAPRLWLAIKTFLIRFLHNKNEVTKISSPMSHITEFLAMLTHAYDTSLCIFNED